MIEIDVVAYLDDDGVLTAELGATAADSKIYPIQKPHTAVVPYIVYNVINEGTTQENLLEMTISFECVDDKYLDLIEISDRIYELLDIQNYAQDIIPSTNYYIYYSKIVGGREIKDTELDLFHKTLDVNIIFHRKVRW